MRIFTDYDFADYQKRIKSNWDARDARFEREIVMIKKENEDLIGHNNYMRQEYQDIKNKTHDYDNIKFENESLLDQVKQLSNSNLLNDLKANQLDMVVSAQKIVLEAYSKLPFLKGIKNGKR